MLIDPYHIMYLTDVLAQIVNIAREIEDAEVYFNIIFFFYTGVVMLKKMTNDTLGSLDALLKYLLNDLKQRLSQTTLISYTQKMKIIVTLDLSLTNDLFVQHISEAVQLISIFKDHLEEEDIRKRFISLLHKRINICIQTGDKGNYEGLQELKNYVEKWYGG